MTLSSVTSDKNFRWTGMLEFWRINHENDSFYNRWWSFSHTTRAAKSQRIAEIPFQSTQGGKNDCETSWIRIWSVFAQSNLFAFKFASNSNLKELRKRKNSQNTLNFHFSLLSSKREEQSAFDVYFRCFRSEDWREWWIMEMLDITLELTSHPNEFSGKQKFSLEWDSLKTFSLNLKQKWLHV